MSKINYELEIRNYYISYLQRNSDDYSWGFAPLRLCVRKKRVE